MSVNLIDSNPCPFCRGHASIVILTGGKRKTDIFKFDRFAVKCDNCEIQIPWSDSKKEAINYWNRRAVPFDLVKNLNEALQLIHETPESVDDSSLRKSFLQMRSIALTGLNLVKDNENG